MNYLLDIANPGQPPARFELPPGIYTIGRSEACKIRLRHPEISERHAVLTLRDSTATIEDLHSSNGTTVDDAPVLEPTVVREDDVIGVGPCLLRVSLPRQASEPPEPVRREPPPPPPPHMPSAPEIGRAHV